jgi:RNA polymerase sigma factor (sigma-70 family)
MAANLARKLALALEEAIWQHSAEQLAAAEPVLRGFLAAAGCSVAGVLAEVCNESLALAVQKNFLRGPAFEEWIVKRHERLVLRWFYARSGSLDLAQELVQELHLKLLTPRTLNSYNPDQLFYPWLWTVVRNLWIGELRRQGRQAGALDAEPTASGAGPVEEATFLETQAQLESALDQLPPLQQQVLRASMAGQKPRAIAQELGLPRPRVFQLLFRARRALERALGLAAEGAGPNEHPVTSREPLERLP